MLIGMLRAMAATGVFAAVHSTLASSRAKRAAANFLGERNRNGLYRVFFVGQSLATSAALAWYIRRQPGRTLYSLTGAPALALRGAQLGSLAMAASAAHEIGMRRFNGLESFEQWRQGGEVEPEPEAQGPALHDGVLHASGPFASSRHPLNFWTIVVLWLNSRMSTNLLAFNLAATAYLVVGSLHEEARLREAYGEKYLEYQRSGVPFYLPRLRNILGIRGDSLREREVPQSRPATECSLSQQT